MSNYERMIIASLPGETPKAKYENLQAIQYLLVHLCYPKRGSEQERWTSEEFANAIAPYFHEYKTVVDNPGLELWKNDL